MKQHASQATNKKPNQKKSRSDSIGESGDVSILGMPITDGKTPANLVFSMEPEEEWGRDPSMWVYKSDPDFEKKTFILNGEPFDVELGLRMRKCCDAWDHIPDEELMYGDDAVGDRESLKDIYFIGLDKTFLVRVVWPDDTEKFPFPREISISSPSNPAVIPCAECAVYGQILMGDGTNLKIRGYHFFNTSPEDCGVIETKIRNRKKSNQPNDFRAISERRDPTPTRSEIANYPLTLGPITIYDKTWEKVQYKTRNNLHLGGQKAAVLKALFNLNATSIETAQPLVNILTEAGLKGKEMSLKKPFSSKSTLKKTYGNLYDSCVKNTGAAGHEKGKGRGVRGCKYYLVMTTPASEGTQ